MSEVFIRYVGDAPIVFMSHRERIPGEVFPVAGQEAESYLRRADCERVGDVPDSTPADPAPAEDAPETDAA